MPVVRRYAMEPTSTCKLGVTPWSDEVFFKEALLPFAWKVFDPSFTLKVRAESLRPHEEYGI